MTDLEKAASKWLPEIWAPGRMCAGPDLSPGKSLYCEHEYLCGHSISCPSPSRDLGFRLLEAMLAKRPQDIVLHMFLDDDKRLLYAVRIGWITDDFSDPDLLTAIIKAAAALAEKDQ